MLTRVALVLSFTAAAMFAGEPSGNAAYLGGTVEGLPTNSSGKILTSNQELFVFVSGNSRISVPYTKIDMIEYGQDVGRRVILGYVVSPIFLLMKGRKHFVTIGYVDESAKHQVMVLRVDKKFVRSALAILEARTGRLVRYQDEEARKFRRN